MSAMFKGISEERSILLERLEGRFSGAIMTGITSFTVGTEHRGTEFHRREEPDEADSPRRKGPIELSTLDIASRLWHDFHNISVGSF